MSSCIPFLLNRPTESNQLGVAGSSVRELYQCKLIPTASIKAPNEVETNETEKKNTPEGNVTICT